MKGLSNFAPALRRSEEAVYHARIILQANDLTVDQPETFYPEHETDVRHIDSGDLIVDRSGPQIVQVKWNTYSFYDTPESYPFPTVMIDEVYKAKPHIKDTWMYLLFNHDRSALCIIDVQQTKAQWTEEERNDPSENRRCIFYFIEKHLCKWSTVAALLP